MRWEELKKNAEKIVEYARPYETAYNKIQSSVKQQKELKTVVKEMVWRTANRQVLDERNRMKEARRVAERQKELYRLVSLICLSYLIGCVASIVSNGCP